MPSAATAVTSFCLLYIVYVYLVEVSIGGHQFQNMCIIKSQSGRTLPRVKCRTDDIRQMRDKMCLLDGGLGGLMLGEFKMLL